MRILVTGFQPFGGEPINPSWEVAKRLPSTLGGHEIVTAELPVEFDAAPRMLLEIVAEKRPDAVISLGQAGTRPAITPELIAVNSKRGKDAAGVEFFGEKLINDGADLHITTLDIKKGVEAMNEAGAPAKISRDAGEYICNAVMYTALANCKGLKCGFVHLPFTVEQAARRGRGEASMALDTMVKGVCAFIPAAVE